MAQRCVRTPRSRAAILLLSLVACAHAPAASAPEDPAAPVRAAITAANAEYAQALLRGDAKAMAAIFTEDGEIIPSNERGFVSGRDAIEAYQARRLEGRRYLEVELTTVDVGISGDVAWETGVTRATIQQPQGAPVAVTGRYLAVWKRGADGTWRIRVDLPVADPFR